MTAMLYKLRSFISFLLYLVALVIALTDNIQPDNIHMIMGATLLCIGAIWRIWGAMYVGSALVSSQPQADDVISHGPYSYVRHPIYFGTIVGGIGVSIIFGNIAIVVAYTLPLCAYYVFLAKHEENMLLKKFGKKYKKYKKCVPMLLPLPLLLKHNCSQGKKVPLDNSKDKTILMKEYGAIGFIFTILIALWDGGRI